MRMARSSATMLAMGFVDYLRLYFNRISQVNGSWRVLGHRHGLGLLGVVRDHAGPGPIEVPAIFDGDNSVGAGDDAAQAEASVLIALVAAKQFSIRLQGLWAPARPLPLQIAFPARLANPSTFAVPPTSESVMAMDEPGATFKVCPAMTPLSDEICTTE